MSNDPNRAIEYILKNSKEYETEFFEIPNWPEYSINRNCDIRRNKRAFGTRSGKILKWTVMETGYAKVALCRNAKRKEYLVHRLMAITFLGDATKMDVCHFDGNKLNNNLSNLRIDSRKGNMSDQVRLGKDNRGEKCGSNKYKQEIIKEVKTLLNNGEPVTSLSKKFSIPYNTVTAIKNGLIWGWL